MNIIGFDRCPDFNADSKRLTKEYMMYGYIYKITIENPESELNGCFYIGQKASEKVVENYYGSGPTLNKYYKALTHRKKCNKLHKDEAIVLGLHREILAWANSREELNELEEGYINAELNNTRCLNRMNGGSGYEDLAIYRIPNEERELNYKCAQESTEEVFVDLPGTHYQISSFGRVKNKETGHINTHYVHNRVGYLRAELFDGKGAKKRYFLQRLVASAFVVNPDSEKKIQVNHKDGDRTNNRYDNLEWVSKSENMLHAYYVSKRKIGFAHGFGGNVGPVWNKGKRLSQETKAKMLATQAINTPERKQEICEKFLGGTSCYELAKEYKLKKSTIKKIIQAQQKRMKYEGRNNDE